VSDASAQSRRRSDQDRKSVSSSSRARWSARRPCVGGRLVRRFTTTPSLNAGQPGHWARSGRRRLAGGRAATGRSPNVGRHRIGAAPAVAIHHHGMLDRPLMAAARTGWRPNTARVGATSCSRRPCQIGESRPATARSTPRPRQPQIRLRQAPDPRSPRDRSRPTAMPTSARQTGPSWPSPTTPPSRRRGAAARGLPALPPAQAGLKILDPGRDAIRPAAAARSPVQSGVVPRIRRRHPSPRFAPRAAAYRRAPDTARHPIRPKRHWTTGMADASRPG